MTEHVGTSGGPALNVVVVQKSLEAESIVSLELAAPDGAALPPFAAGAHVDVEVHPDLVRQYSLWNDPVEQDRYRIAVLLEPQSRGGSRAVHQDLREGQLLRIGFPRNNFQLAERARRSVLFAGGIGITPLLAMAYQLHRWGSDFTLHYCARTRARAAFAERLTRAPFANSVRMYFDDGPAEQGFSLERHMPEPEADVHLYICGPAGFLAAVRERAALLGWQAAQIHSEAFTQQVSLEGEGFLVRAAASGITVEVGADQSIAQALTDAGVDVLTSCEQGVCGTCLTRVLEGVPDHRDAYLTDEEKAANASITICCSRARSRILVLDI